MVVERVAARPVGEPRPREPHRRTVVGDLLAGVQEQVADPGARDEVRHGVGALGERRQRRARHPDAVVAHRPEAVRETAAGQADLAEERGQREPGEDRLLAAFPALQRVHDVDHRAPGGHPVRERADRGRGRPADPLGPLGCLRHPVGLAEDVPPDLVGPHRERREELLVGEAVDDEHVDQRQHDGGVGARHDTHPLGAEVGEGVVALGGQRHDLRAAAHRPGQVGADVAGVSTRHHPGVGAAHAAEADEEVGVLGEVGPGGRLVPQVERAARADEVGEQHRAGAAAVVADRAGAAADRVEEPVQLALRVVQPARAAPAVGAAEDRAVAELRPDPPQLAGEQVERGVPVDLDVLLRRVAAPGVRAGAVLEPAAAHARPRHPRTVAVGVRDVADRGRGVGVVGVRAGRHDVAAVGGHLDEVGAPVRAGLPDPAHRTDANHDPDGLVDVVDQSPRWVPIPISSWTPRTGRS